MLHKETADLLKEYFMLSNEDEVPSNSTPASLLLGSFGENEINELNQHPGHLSSLSIQSTSIDNSIFLQGRPEFRTTASEISSCGDKKPCHRRNRSADDKLETRESITLDKPILKRTLSKDDMSVSYHKGDTQIEEMDQEKPSKGINEPHLFFNYIRIGKLNVVASAHLYIFDFDDWIATLDSFFYYHKYWTWTEFFQRILMQVAWTVTKNTATSRVTRVKDRIIKNKSKVMASSQPNPMLFMAENISEDDSVSLFTRKIKFV